MDFSKVDQRADIGKDLKQFKIIIINCTTFYAIQE